MTTHSLEQTNLVEFSKAQIWLFASDDDITGFTFFMAQYTLLAILSSFRAYENILNNRAWHLCDMHIEGPSVAM